MESTIVEEAVLELIEEVSCSVDMSRADMSRNCWISTLRCVDHLQIAGQIRPQTWPFQITSSEIYVFQTSESDFVEALKSLW